MIGTQGVTLKCYDVNLINQKESDQSTKDQKAAKKDAFGFHKGHKMDQDPENNEQGHNWLFLREYVSLSFSYMCFVINKKKGSFQGVEKY